MAHGKGYKLVLWHGAKYHTDRKSRHWKANSWSIRPVAEKPARPPAAAAAPPAAHSPEKPAPAAEIPAAPKQPRETAAAVDETSVAELVKRGVGEGDARKLLVKLPQGQPVMDQLEYADGSSTSPGAKFRTLRDFIFRGCRTIAQPRVV